MFLYRSRRSFELALPLLSRVVTKGRCHYSTRTGKPLRVLFCGSDEFSCASLQAVYDEHVLNSGSIASIDVMCRPGKRAGRGLKCVREVPIKGLATRLGLPIHERDTFTGWEIPPRDGQAINLLIAVSFGLLIPRRILDSVRYGGLNVHPSLLPDLRGPAPLHRALLHGDDVSGMTLQSLHPTKFDHGKILYQKAFEVPNKDSCSYMELLEIATQHGAKILAEGLRKEMYLPTYKPQQHVDHNIHSQASLRHAPKITTADKELDFTKFDTGYMVRQERVLGRPWTTIITNEGREKRLVLHGLCLPTAAQRLRTREYATQQNNENYHGFHFKSSTGGSQCLHTAKDTSGSILLFDRSGEKVIRVAEMTIDGARRTSAVDALYNEAGMSKYSGT